MEGPEGSLWQRDMCGSRDALVSSGRAFRFILVVLHVCWDGMLQPVMALIWVAQECGGGQG